MGKIYSEEILKVKEKKEFSNLPDSLVEKALILSKQDISEARALLRKYFGVFITNKIYKLNSSEILNSHLSSKNRNYSKFYNELFGNICVLNSVVDIGCGVNGFSYSFLKDSFGEINYLGIEAVGQLVDKMNKFFNEKNFNNAQAICEDIFNMEKICNLISKQDSPKAILLLQVIDALEGLERNFSKKFLIQLHEIISEEDYIIISMPMKSISGKNKFEAKRGWLRWFLEENFIIEEFFIEDERIFRCRKK